VTITQSTAAKKGGIRIKSRIKAGENLEKLASNHSQTVRGIRIKSRIKAGLCPGDGSTGGGTTPTGK
jgi:hypothetical protein